MFNKVILAGNLARDIEVRYAGANNTAIGNTAIATNRRYKSADGEQKEEVMFIDITFFGRTAEVANQSLKKGSKLLVEGSIVLNQWTAQDGSKRSKHSVSVESMQMLGGKEDNKTSSQPQQNAPSCYTQQNGHGNQQLPEIDISDEQIPF